MRGLILAAAVAATTAAFGLTPAFANSTYSGDAGVRSLGVDISGVVLDANGVQNFLNGLGPDARKAVKSACATYTSPANRMTTSPQTQMFCANVPNG